VRLQLVTSWRRTPLAWRFDFHCVRRDGTWPHLGVADPACMVDQQMEMSASKHATGYWVCFDVRKLEAADLSPTTPDWRAAFCFASSVRKAASLSVTYLL
jgi:hypothetical protein